MIIFQIILVLCSLAFFFFISLILFVVGSWVMKVLGTVIHFISYPVRKLLNAVNGLLDRGIDSIEIERTKSRFYVFGDFKGFLMFVCLFLFAVIAALMGLKHVTDLEKLIFTVLDNTVLGASLLVLRNIGTSAGETANQITTAMLFAIGFSAGVTSFYSRPLEDAKWYIRFIAGFFALCIMVALSIVLEDVFAAAGNWGYRTFITLYESGGGGVFATVGRMIALAILGYLAIMALLLVVEQYVSFIAFVPISLSVYMLISEGLFWLMELTHIPVIAIQVVSGIMTIVIFVTVEVLRNKYDKIDKYVRAILGRIFGKKHSGKSAGFTK